MEKSQNKNSDEKAERDAVGNTTSESLRKSGAQSADSQSDSKSSQISDYPRPGARVLSEELKDPDMSHPEPSLEAGSGDEVTSSWAENLAAMSHHNSSSSNNSSDTSPTDSMPTKEGQTSSATGARTGEMNKTDDQTLGSPSLDAGGVSREVPFVKEHINATETVESDLTSESRPKLWKDDNLCSSVKSTQQSFTDFYSCSEDIPRDRQIQILQQQLRQKEEQIRLLQNRNLLSCTSMRIDSRVQTNKAIIAPGSKVSIQEEGGAVKARDTDHQRRKLQAHMAEVLQRDEDVFVETGAFHSAVKCLDKHNHVTIIGCPGSGKTALAYHLLRNYRQNGFDVLFLDDPTELRHDRSPREQTAILIDEAFGSVSFSPGEFKKWHKLFELELMPLLSYGSERKSNLKVIFTSRNYIYKEARPHLIFLENCLFNTNTVIDLSADLVLSKEERMAILSKHKVKNNFQLSKDTMERICDLDCPHGFPHTCALFFVLDQFQEHPTEFFKNPLPCLQDTFRRLERIDPYKWAALVLIVLSEGKLNVASLVMEDETFHNLKEITSLTSYKKFFQDRYIIYWSLSGSYLKNDGDTFSFNHSSLHDTVAYLIGVKNPKFVIENTTVDFLFERVRVHLYQKSHHDGTREDLTNFTILLSQEWNSLLAKQFAKYILKREFSLVCSHQALQRQDIIEGMFHFMESEKDQVLQEFIVGLADHLYQKSFLYWSVWNKSDKLCKYVVSRFNFSNEIKLEAAVACCFSGNEEGFNWIVPTIPDELLSQVSVHHVKVKTPREPTEDFPDSDLNLFVGVMKNIGKRFENLTLLAGRFGRLQIVRSLIEIKAVWSVNQENVQGDTLLQKSCLGNNKQLVQYLINREANINKQTLLGLAPLHYAAATGHVAIIQTLLGAYKSTTKEEINIDVETSTGITPFMFACMYGHYRAAEVLLQNKASVNWKDKEKNTAMMFSCLTGHHHMIRLLVSKGGDVNTQNIRGISPLFLACGNGHIESVLELLRYSANVNIQTEKGETALLLACQNNNESLVKILVTGKALVNLKDVHNQTPLHYMCDKGNVKIAQMLLEHNPDLEIAANKSFTPLHLACYNGHDEIALMLVKLKANVNTLTEDGDSPLLLASMYGHYKQVEMLLDSNADVNVQNNDGASPLITASQNGHAKIVKLLLIKGADVNVKTKDDATPLFMACQCGSDEVVQMLLDRKCNVNVVTKTNDSALALACENGNVKIAQKLLNHKADVNQRNSNGHTPLFFACQVGPLELVKLLIQHNADVSASAYDGLTPLILASIKNQVLIVKTLLSKQANVNACTKEGCSSLLSACEGGHHDIIDLLLRANADVTAKDNRGWSPFHLAVNNGHTKVVETLLMHKSDVILKFENLQMLLTKTSQKGFSGIAEILLRHNVGVNVRLADRTTPLQWASFMGHNKTVEVLLTHGADVNMVDRRGQSPLILASKQGCDDDVSSLSITSHTDDNTIVQPPSQNEVDSNILGPCDSTPLMLATQKCHLDVAETLVTFGTDVNVSTYSGLTALLIACEYGHVEIVFFLCSHSANVNIPSINGITPLMIASQNGHVRVTDVLLKYGAYVNTAADNGQTPLSIASENGHFTIVQKLVSHEANINTQARDGTTALYMATVKMHEKIMDFLLRQGADVNTRHDSGITPFMLVCQNGSKEFVELMLKHNADVNITTKDGVTALYLAICQGYAGIVKFLLEGGADVNAKSNDGITAMMLACYENHYTIADMLIKHNCDINEKDADGRSPLIIASLLTTSTIVNLLLEHSSNVNIRDNHGSTALTIASEYGHTEHVKMLLSSGADVDAADADGDTSLLLACSEGHTEIVEMLLKYGAKPNVPNNKGVTPLVAARRRNDQEMIQMLSINYEEIIYSRE